MILDTIGNFKIYSEVHPRFTIALDFLNETELSNLPLGRHELDDGVFAISDKYLTVSPSETFIECHKKYIDIQVIVKGREKMGVCHRETCITHEYMDEEDYQKLEGSLDFVTVREGFFTIFFPHDGHMPQVMAENEAEEVRKIVIKIPV